MTQVYVLYHPNDPLTVYVGVTKLVLSARRNAHIQTAKKDTSSKKVSVWIRDLLELGLKPFIATIYNVSDTEDKLACEEHYIRWYRENGFNVLNMDQGTYFRTEETRRKLSVSQRERWKRKKND